MKPWNTRYVADTPLSQTDDVTEALSDVREMLQQNNPSDWQTEFAGLVQDIVRQDAGWAWEGFWHMILHNITQVPCQVCRVTNEVYLSPFRRFCLCSYSYADQPLLSARGSRLASSLGYNRASPAFGCGGTEQLVST